MSRIRSRIPSSTEPLGEASVYSASGMDNSSRILFLRVEKTGGISGRDVLILDVQVVDSSRLQCSSNAQVFQM